MLIVRHARVPAVLLPAELAGRGVLESPEPWVEVDISIEGDRIWNVFRSGAESPVAGVGAPGHSASVDLGGQVVFSALVDAHVHLDKTHTWERSPNRTGTFADALATLNADRAHWTEEDLLQRAELGLRTAYEHGTSVLRTHVDTWLPEGERSHAVMAELRRRWAGRIDLQTVPICGGATYLSSSGSAVADLAMKYGASALGGFLTRESDLGRQIDRLLQLAVERGVGLDLHVDENDDPAAEVLRAVAGAVLNSEFPHPVVCGHCCNLATQSPERVRSTIDLVRTAGIGIVSLPDCNLYLQGRRRGAYPRSPVWRGLTLMHDLMDAGVAVACASDNVRDAFHPYGDYDPIAVWTMAVKLGHLDERLGEAPAVITSTAARLVGRPDLGRVVPGSPARLVAFEARSFAELLGRAPGKRRRIDGTTISP
jgi:cytosine deaminase